VWRGNQWVDYRPANRDAGATAQANAAGGSADANRSFSYQPATPLRTFPGSVANEVIDGSYGIRGAESKANGSYH
jgi:hypothetical protein